MLLSSLSSSLLQLLLFVLLLTSQLDAARIHSLKRQAPTRELAPINTPSSTTPRSSLHPSQSLSSPSPSSSRLPIFSSLPDSPSHTSNHYKLWSRLVSLGYSGGEVERALVSTKDDVDRAFLLLSRKETGFHGLHCLRKGACFNDPRQNMFQTPRPTGPPVRPPRLEELPPLTGGNGQQNQPQQQQQQQPPLGIDYSSSLLKQHRLLESSPPHLNPYDTTTSPLPELEDRARSSAPLRSDPKLGMSEKSDALAVLMRKWLSTINSPFHTKKPGSTHESDPEVHPLPDDTHPTLVPVKMRRAEKGKYGKDERVVVDWYHPTQHEVKPIPRPTG